MHVARLDLQLKPTDDLISKVGALCNCLERVMETIIEVCFCASVAFILGITEIPFHGREVLEKASKS